jgi:hypothetical protein
LPSWLSFDPATRSFKGNPPAGAADLDISITATDPQATSTSASFRLALSDTNDAPTVVSAPVGSYFLKVGDSISVNFSSSFGDVDIPYGDRLVYSAKRVDGGALPAWLKFDANSGLLSGTPSGAEMNLLSINLFATDASGLATSVRIDLQVLPPPAQTTSVETVFTSSASTLVIDSTPVPTFSFLPTIAPPGAVLTSPEGARSDTSPTTSTTSTTVVPSGQATALAGFVIDTANQTRSEGFQVAILRPVGDTTPSAGGLMVLRTMQDVTSDSSGRIEVQIPKDLFGHTREDATVSLQASQVNGAPLPSWLQFDAKNGTFVGTPPAGLVGEVEVRIVAVDNQGNRVETVFRIKVGDKSALLGKRSLTAQLAGGRWAMLERGSQAQRDGLKLRSSEARVLRASA